MKKLILCLAVLVFSVVTATGLASCGGPAISASHFEGGVLKVDNKNCPECHRQGISDAPRMPDSHERYSVDRCSKCHKTQ